MQLHILFGKALTIYTYCFLRFRTIPLNKGIYLCMYAATRSEQTIATLILLRTTWNIVQTVRKKQFAPIHPTLQNYQPLLEEKLREVPRI